MPDDRLDDFRQLIDWHLACGALADYDLPVTSDDGGFPVVVATEDERLSIVLGRVRAVGGFANLFVKGKRRSVRMASVIGEACAIGEADDELTGSDAPGVDATVGMFLDYVERQPNGVMVSEAVGQPSACARDTKTVTLKDATV